MTLRKTSPRKVRYAVVGLGNIAQVAVLPAFAHAEESSELAALISSDRDKLREMGDHYGVVRRGSYDELEAILKSAHVDVAYIAVPNAMHRALVERCASVGVHVLCEKPLAMTVADCEAMIRACRAAGVKLMTAYRLHFEETNLRAIEIARSGVIGEPRFFSASFAQQAREGDIRVQQRPGAGPLFDLGVYCINAARYLFRADPVQVTASMFGHPGDERFAHVEETVAATLRFPGDRVASFVASFGAADRARYEVVGTEGSLALEQAYEYATSHELTITSGGKTRRKKFGKRDQIAAEIEYFATCVREGRDPEPSGREGMGDVRIMLAIRESARRGVAIDLEAVEHDAPPAVAQRIDVPPHGKPKTLHVESAGK